MSDYFHVNRAGITDSYITQGDAEQLLATRNCQGDLHGGFSYWSQELEDGMKLVHVHVTPCDPDSIPPRVLQELEDRTRGTGEITTAEAAALFHAHAQPTD